MLMALGIASADLQPSRFVRQPPDGYATAVATPSPPEAVKKFNGRDALLRVRDGKPNTDAEHRVPTDFFTAPLC